VSEVASLTYTQPSVIQSYIRDPLCLDGYKFDLRLYVLVTSFKPLEAFIHTEGFTRIRTKKFSLDPADLKNNFIHLTNSSIQMQNHQGPSSDNPSRDEDGTRDSGGSKIALKGPYGLWVRLEKRGFDIRAVRRNISQLIVKSLVIVGDKVRHQPCSFEVFGYDVLIDSDLKCWLLKVNSSPSPARENVLDVRVKNIILNDTIQLIDPAPFDREAVRKILQRRFRSFSKNKIGLHKDSELEYDLKEILGDYVPRKYGEVPKILGGCERLCPHTAIYTHIVKLKSKIIKSD
jgi:Tubulin-tyrosine ligase family